MHSVMPLFVVEASPDDLKLCQLGVATPILVYVLVNGSTSTVIAWAIIFMVTSLVICFPSMIIFSFGGVLVSSCTDDDQFF